MYVSQSEFNEIELIWYACAFAKTLRVVAATTLSFDSYFFLFLKNKIK